MNKITIEYNSIIIIESLRPQDLKTGEILYGNLKSTHLEQEGIQLIKVSDRNDFIDIMNQIKFLMMNNEIFRPIINIEAHGDKSVMQFTDYSTMEWSELMDITRCINRICNNNLVLFLACCEGYHFIMSTSIKNYSPCGYLFSPKESILEDDVQLATTEFFNEIIINGDLDDVANLLKNKKIYCFKSEIFFLDALTKSLIKDYYENKNFKTDNERENFINHLSDKFLGRVDSIQTSHVMKCFNDYISNDSIGDI